MAIFCMMAFTSPSRQQINLWQIWVCSWGMVRWVPMLTIVSFDLMETWTAEPLMLLVQALSLLDLPHPHTSPATQPQPAQSQPRAVPSTQATPPYVSHPGAPSRGRNQGSQPPGRQHLGWQQQRYQGSQIVRRQTPGGYRSETHFPERQINLPSNSSPRFQSARVDPNHASSNDSGLTCQLCRGNGHTAVTCKSRDSVCYRCHQKGHFARVCDQ